MGPSLGAPTCALAPFSSKPQPKLATNDDWTNLFEGCLVKVRSPFPGVVSLIPVLSGLR